jgi:hypothetical protein
LFGRSLSSLSSDSRIDIALAIHAIGISNENNHVQQFRMR